MNNRKSIRLPGYDYTQPGAYFITIVTHQRKTVLGSVRDQTVSLTALGELVLYEWKRLAARFPTIQIDDFVIMPNHLHGILVILGLGTGGSKQDRLTPIHPHGPATEIFGKPIARSIPTIVRAFKASTTFGYRNRLGTDQPLWQGNYYEHIIHNERDWEACSSYILDNPKNWEQDGEFHQS